MFVSTRSLPALLALALALPACADPEMLQDDPPDTPPTGPANALDARLSAMSLVLAATAPSGGGPFDNYLPCVRRGIINYHDTESGSAVIIDDCDLGGGVSVHGSGELSWVGPDLSPTRDTVTRMLFTGELMATIDGVAQPLITTYELDAIDYSVSGSSSATPGERLQLDSVDITLDGGTRTVSGGTLAADIFDSSGMTIDAIDNPGHDIAALSDADVKRLGHHAFMYMARVLLNETLEARGAHTHEIPCGTLDVTSSQGQLPTVTAAWNLCESLGIFYQGDFTLEWQVFSESEMSMTVQAGPTLTLGGGVPTVELTSATWTFSSFSPDGTEGRISGQLTGTGGVRDFDFPVLLDD